MDIDLSELEHQVLVLPAGEALPLTQDDMSQLLTDPAYRSSLGTPAYATHFRRPLPDGRGIHLVIATDGSAGVHWDRFDPQASPTGLLLHLLTDAPDQALSLLAAGAAVLRRLGSR
jgi:hypothetical protein